jgi:hypothetical protein
MQPLTFQELQIKFWPEIEEFCFKVLKKQSEAVIIAASVFTTLQTMIAGGWFENWETDQRDIKTALRVIAYTKCRERLRHLELFPENKLG